MIPRPTHFSIFLLLLLGIVAPRLAAQTTEQIARYPVCLTPYLIDRHFHPERKGGQMEMLAAGISVDRETRQRDLVTPQGHFRIHYDISGPDAIATLDRNTNGLPDYIDSAAFHLEKAWVVEIEELGYKAPHDNGVQGPEIDVFISALDGRYYGLANPEFNNVISNDPPRLAGYLILDNDYVGYPTAGIAGLKATSAHEFHHVVQFASYRIEDGQQSLYEATSTWMEKQVHPEVKDYRNYTDLLLSAPQDFPFSTHQVNNNGTGYGHILYLDYLSERINRDVVRRIWEEFEREEISFVAIDNALRATSNLNLENSWCEFALWCYYTGRRAVADSSYLDEAKSLPTMKESQSRSLDEEEMILFQGELRPLAFALDRVVLRGSNPNIRDTIDFLVTNARSDFGKGGATVPLEKFTLSVRKQATDDYIALKRGETIVGYYRFTSDGPHFCVDPILGGKRSVSIAVRTAPQPFVNDGANQMVIAVGSPGEQITNARVWIYSVAMTRIREITQTSLQGVNNLLGVVWDGRDNDLRLVPPGVYIYELSLNNGEPILGKFVVVGR